MDVNFFAESADKILSREKCQTILPNFARWLNLKVGDTLTLYTDLMSSQCHKLGEATVASIEPINIKSAKTQLGGYYGDVFLGGAPLGVWQLEPLVRDNGFCYISDFFRFFNMHYGNDFQGVIIKWCDFKAAGEE